MVRNSYRKLLARQFVKSRARFIAITTIILLGVAFFAGIRSTGPMMRKTMDSYYQNQNISDFNLVSVLGFEEADIENLKTHTDYQIQPIKSVLTYTTINQIPVPLELRSTDPLWAENKSLNLPVLMEGKLPEKAGEIALDLQFWESDRENHLAIGQTLTVFSNDGQEKLEEKIATKQFTIVGYIKSPLSITKYRGVNQLNYFGYVHPSDLIIDYYTEIFLKDMKLSPDYTSNPTDHAKNFSYFHNNYKHASEERALELEKLATSLASNRWQNIQNEANTELDDAKNQISDAKQKLEEAEKDLTQAKIDLQEGEEKLASEKTKFDQEIQDAETKIQDGEAEYNRGHKQLQGKENELNAGYKQYEAGLSQLNQSKAQLDLGYENIKILESSLAALQAQIEALESAPSPIPTEIPESTLPPPSTPEPTPEPTSPPEPTPPPLPNIQELKAQLQILEQTYQTAQADLAVGQAQYDQGLATLTQSKTQLDQGKAALTQGKNKLNSAKKELDQAKITLENGKKEGQEKIAQAETELADAKVKLAEGELTFQKESTQANQDIAKAEADIAQAQLDLADIDDPEWIVFSLLDNASFSDYLNNCQRLEAVGTVFPLIFFIVAALVTLTNMTRTVEDDRLQIAILKALGYKSWAIAWIYILFALTACIVGSALGLLSGLSLFPLVIFDAYSSIYNVNTILLSWNWENGLISLAIALTCGILPAILISQKELKEKTAQLLLPKAPKPGQRILLERLTFLWKKMNFTQKVTARNIFRYKKRLFMTLFGVAGCTALMLVGFGLRDSVSSIGQLQFGEIRHQDLDIVLVEEADALDKITQALGKNPAIKEFSPIYEDSYELSKEDDAKILDVNISVPLALKDINQYMQFQTRGQSVIDPQQMNTGAIISEKISILLDLKIGDEIYLKSKDSINSPLKSVKIQAITENYAGHYVYLSPSLYQTIFESTPTANRVIANLASDKPLDQNSQRLLSDELDDQGALYISFKQNVMANFSSMLDALDVVVVVLVISAAALAFVVLFSLTVINVEERKRELATIKVLGFFEREVAGYIFRESALLTALGGFIGLGLGRLLHGYVITTMEVDLAMFGRIISPLSFALAWLLTLGFAFLVNGVMYPSIRKINMVESMKSVD